MGAPGTLITCSKCKAVLGAELFGLPEFQPCPSCQSPVQLAVFPALFRQETVVPAERVMAEGEASCFYHPEKKAATVCEGCGRFLCALCDVDFDGQHVCPACLESGQQKGKIKKLQNKITRHDKIALIVALAPLLMFYLTLLTAPAALFYAIWHWKSPPSLAPSWPRVNLSIAIGVASLQIAGWVVFFVYLAGSK